MKNSTFVFNTVALLVVYALFLAGIHAHRQRVWLANNPTRYIHAHFNTHVIQDGSWHVTVK